MNACVILLVTALIIAACGDTSIKTNGYIEDSENFVAPQINLWKMLNKSKGKSTLKNFILFQKSDISSKKHTHRENIEGNHPTAVELSTEKDLEKKSTTQIKKENNQDKVNDKVSTNSPDSYVDYSKVIPSLHLEIEPNKKFVHSIVDGWTF